MKKSNSMYMNICGYTAMQVITGSMSDTINVNDVVIVKLTDDVKKNDIISYIDDNAIITHRIVDITDTKITTKGDANNSNDKPISKSDVIGKVEYIIPKVGIWKNVLSTPVVYISLGITIILIFLINFNKDNRISECIEKEETKVK